MPDSSTRRVSTAQSKPIPVRAAWPARDSARRAAGTSICGGVLA